MPEILAFLIYVTRNGIVSITRQYFCTTALSVMESLTSTLSFHCSVFTSTIILLHVGVGLFAWSSIFPVFFILVEIDFTDAVYMPLKGSVISKFTLHLINLQHRTILVCHNYMVYCNIILTQSYTSSHLHEVHHNQKTNSIFP